jgi:hypothetical protein
MPSFEVSGPIDADVEVGVGLIEMIASDGTAAVVEVVPTRPGRSGDESLAREAQVSLDSGRLRVKVPKRLNLFGQSDSVDVRCQVPAGSRATVSTSYGSVRVRGGFGDCRIVAKYGNVSADTVGDLVLEAPYGTVDIADVTGRLDATTGYGQVRIGRIGGDAHVKSSYGTIELGTTAGAVEVATSGPVTLERALGDVTARSAHGPIRIREVAGGTIRLDNGYADVEVGVAHGVAAWIDATSAHGRVRNELTPDPSAAGSDRSVELHLRTNHGDVSIRRAASPRKEASA